MRSIRIETHGLTLTEILELVSVVRACGGVEAAKLIPLPPGGIQHRSVAPPQMSTGPLHLMVSLTEVPGGIHPDGGQHLYEAVAEGVVGKLWDSVNAKLSGMSTVQVGVRLYGPLGELIKQYNGLR